MTALALQLLPPLSRHPQRECFATLLREREWIRGWAWMNGVRSRSPPVAAPPR